MDLAVSRAHTASETASRALIERHGLQLATERNASPDRSRTGLITGALDQLSVTRLLYVGDAERARRKRARTGTSRGHLTARRHDGLPEQAGAASPAVVVTRQCIIDRFIDSVAVVIEVDDIARNARVAEERCLPGNTSGALSSQSYAQGTPSPSWSTVALQGTTSTGALLGGWLLDTVLRGASADRSRGSNSSRPQPVMIRQGNTYRRIPTRPASCTADTAPARWRLMSTACRRTVSGSARVCDKTVGSGGQPSYGTAAGSGAFGGAQDAAWTWMVIGDLHGVNCAVADVAKKLENPPLVNGAAGS